MHGIVYFSLVENCLELIILILKNVPIIFKYGLFDLLCLTGVIKWLVRIAFKITFLCKKHEFESLKLRHSISSLLRSTLQQMMIHRQFISPQTAISPRSFLLICTPLKMQRTKIFFICLNKNRRNFENFEAKRLQDVKLRIGDDNINNANIRERVIMFSSPPLYPSTSQKFQSSRMTNTRCSVVLVSVFHRLLHRKNTQFFYKHTYIINVLVKLLQYLWKNNSICKVFKQITQNAPSDHSCCHRVALNLIPLSNVFIHFDGQHLKISPLRLDQRICKHPYPGGESFQVRTKAAQFIRRVCQFESPKCRHSYGFNNWTRMTFMPYSCLVLFTDSMKRAREREERWIPN
ncbi:hypothetical protein EGR_00487 [Echinococcus granulosus]|uniref:Uncharacterized protein n=1 Tax=Echinococcus granulosus TaxID=6210 RepID=W6V0W4_ECHGR|nr:hypothetical protein EGR_00487 [Echinococcus granulosus]EUB64537.1 hypothetical protein EGR_00487 [Echinococcus granulosus]